MTTSQPRSREYAAWRASWGLALRMARRDVRRHRGRSLVVLLMVSLPTALLIFGITANRTLTPSDEVLLPATLGSADALVFPPLAGSEETIVQDGSGSNWLLQGKGRQPIPGYDPEATAADNAGAIGEVLGGRAIPVEDTEARVRLGQRTVPIAALVVDARVGLGPKAVLLSGRWAQTPYEVVVTPQGVRRGLPSTGTLTLLDGSREVTRTIVGTAQGWIGPIMADVVSLGPVGSRSGDPQSGSWLILGSGDITGDRLKALGRYGLPIRSAYLVRHPLTIDELPEELQGATEFGASETRIYTLGGGALLILITGLLVAPAFAVSAARQRRTLALAASNGATTAHLRRTVLGQAVVLGALAAILGAGAGIAAAYAYQQWNEANSEQTLYLPLTVPWTAVLGVTACAVIASIGAALLPARRLDRLDIVGVMKGQNVSRPASRVLPVVGLVLMAGGSALLILGMRRVFDALTVPLGALLLVLGALALIPRALVLIGRLAARLPVALRMAARDAARQRARSGPAVAAVVGGVALLTTILVAVASDTAQSARDYEPFQRSGEGYLSLDSSLDASWQSQTAPLRAVAPQFVINPVHQVTGAMWTEGQAPDRPHVNVQIDGCTPEQAIIDTTFWNSLNSGTSGPASFQPATSPCQLIGDDSPLGRAIKALPAEEIIRRLELTGASADTVRGGGAVVIGTPRAVVNGRLRIVLGAPFEPFEGAEVGQAPTTAPGQPPTPRVERVVSLPAVSIPRTKDSSAQSTGATDVLIAADAVDAARLPHTLLGAVVHDPAGPISEETERAVNEALGARSAFNVERGFVRDDALAIALIVTAFTLILLIVTLTSTALAMAEQQREDAAMAAVGATRSTRRAFAAAQAFVTAIIGTVLGFVVGFVPGYAFTFPLTASSYDFVTGREVIGDPTVVVPWLPLAIAVLGVPLLAALLAAGGVRRAPVLTRRTA